MRLEEEAYEAVVKRDEEEHRGNLAKTLTIMIRESVLWHEHVQQLGAVPPLPRRK